MRGVQKMLTDNFLYEPLVTIIIPVYNGANYIRESISSALGQTYQNVEVIVVNDGSNDQGETEKIVKEYGEKVKYIYKENGGVSSALNVGISYSKGEWISWLSHDDLYYPDKIQKQVQLLNEILVNPNKDITKYVLFSKSEFIDKDGKKILGFRFNRKKSTNSLDLIVDNIRRNSFSGCTFLLPRNCFDDIGFFNEEYLFIQDKDLWYRLLFGGYKFIYLPEVLVKSRMHKDQTTHKIPERGVKESKEFYRWVIDSAYSVEEYRKFDTFYKIGCYIRRRGHIEIADYAFQKARLLVNCKKIYEPKLFFAGICNDIIYKLKRLLKQKFYSIHKLRN